MVPEEKFSKKIDCARMLVINNKAGRTSKILFIKLVLIDEGLKAIIVNSFTQEKIKKNFMGY